MVFVATLSLDHNDWFEPYLLLGNSSFHYYIHYIVNILVGKRRFFSQVFIGTGLDKNSLSF